MDVNTALKDGGRGAGAGIRGKYLSGVLVVVEMTLAVVLLTGAGLMMRSFVHAYTRPSGVDTTNVLTMRMDLPRAKYGKPAQQLAFQQTLAEHLRALPGVESAAVASTVPGGGNMSMDYELEGSPADAKRRPNAQVILTGDGYFETLRVAVRQGRILSVAEHKGGLPLAVVNQTFADKAWPNENAIGKRMRVFSGEGSADWMAVTGVIPDILQNSQAALKDGGRNAGSTPIMYFPLRLREHTGLAVIARTRVPAATLAQPFRREVQAIDADLPVHDVITLEAGLALQYWPLRVFGAMFAIFAGIALLLATVGLYAVVAYGVSQRTQEIGVRVALGASAGSILRMIFSTGMRQMAIGLALGLAAAFGVTRVLTSLLVGVSPTDPVTYSVVAVVLIAAATLGCAIPARRAMRVDPAIALRHE
jgi:putative ABC transport system permease protein